MGNKRANALMVTSYLQCIRLVTRVQVCRVNSNTQTFNYEKAYFKIVINSVYTFQNLGSLWNSSRESQKRRAKSLFNKARQNEAMCS